MPTMALMVGGMSCRHCVREVTSRLRDVASVGAPCELSYPVQLLDETGEAAEA